VHCGKCIALKKLCIKSCPVSNQGLEALANGCPSLVKVKLKKCRAVTMEGAEWLKNNRESLAVNLDNGETELQDASASDGAQENGGGAEFPTPAVPSQMAAAAAAAVAASNMAGSTSRSSSMKWRLGLLSGRNLVACTLRRWSSANSNGRGS